MNTKTISLLFALFVAQASASLRHGKNANRALVEEVEEEFCEATYYVYKAKELKESKIKKSGKEFSAPLYKMLDDNTYVPAGIYTSILNYVHDEEGLCMSTTMIGIGDVNTQTYADQAVVQGYCNEIGNNDGNAIVGGTGKYAAVYGVLDYQPADEITGVVLRTCPLSKPQVEN